MKEGFSAETSGGLLVVISKEKAQAFVERLRDEFGEDSWLMGEVVKGKGNARIADECQFVEV